MLHYAMKTFPTIEDYLEVIAGYRDTDGKNVNGAHAFIFAEFKPIVNLARYDVGVLETMAYDTLEGKALTERQAELAVKIVLKYQRQLAQKGIDVMPAEHPVWRVPLRKLDYSKSLSVEGNSLVIKFPYNAGLIEGVREFNKNSQGKSHWDKQQRAWKIALTEYNLSWMYAWAKANQFQIDSKCQEIMDQIHKLETTDNFKIELTLKNNQLVIDNADKSLIDYVNEHCGGFEFDNLFRLVDVSSVLGYTIDPDILQALTVEHGPVVCDFLTLRVRHLRPELLKTADFIQVLDYADLAQRWPVVLFEPDASFRMLDQLKQHRPADSYLHLSNKPITDIPAGIKYIHTIRPIVDIRIPLLVSSAGMMFGGDKSLMSQKAEKIVYYTTDVYNKKK